MSGIFIQLCLKENKDLSPEHISKISKTKNRIEGVPEIYMSTIKKKQKLKFVKKNVVKLNEWCKSYVTKGQMKSRKNYKSKFKEKWNS